MEFLLLLCSVVLISACVWWYRRDRRRERMRTRDAVGPAVRREIKAERVDALRRRERFQAALRDADRNVSERKP